MSLRDKNIVVGVTGGIAAFKAVELVRELGRRGAKVRVMMTEAATKFVGPITFSGITGRPAVTDLWAADYAGEVHVELTRWADAIVVAPATMNTLARAAAGQANDVVLATLACAGSPVFFAPAMHQRMWEHPANQRNVAQLKEHGAIILGPVHGELASGELGEGRMLEPVQIADTMEEQLVDQRDLEGRTIVISAGPTCEDLDPVRYIGNRSTGKMGYALATQAARRGARVVLVSGPVSLEPPADVELVKIRSAVDMYEALLRYVTQADAVIMAAAVADYRPAHKAAHKIKKGGGLTLELVRNPDILAELGQQRRGDRPILVGFALETEAIEQNAREKLERKRVDLVIANEASVGLGHDTNRAIVVSGTASTPLPEMSKLSLADTILDKVGDLLASAPAPHPHPRLN